MATTACNQCGHLTDLGVCPHCGAGVADPVGPGLLAMPGRADPLWSRIALVATALVTLAIAAGLLFMTVRGLSGRN
jgi:hypothetical protein